MVQRSLRSWCRWLSTGSCGRALEEQQVNEEFDAAQVDFLSRRSAGTLCYVSHEEAARRLGLPVQ